MRIWSLIFFLSVGFSYTYSQSDATSDGYSGDVELGHYIFPLKQNGRWVYINLDGRIIDSAGYHWAGSFKNNAHAIVSNGNAYAVINSSLDTIFPFEFEEIENIKRGAMKAKHNGKWGFIVNDGSITLPYEFDDIQMLDTIGFLLKKDSKWGLKRYEGKYVLPIQYDTIIVKSVNYYDEVFNLSRLRSRNYLLVKMNGKQGIYSTTGQAILEPVYEKVSLYNDSLILFKKNNLWGCVNYKGERLFEPEWNQLKPVGHPFFMLKKDSLWALHNMKMGKQVTDFSYAGFNYLSTSYVAFSDNGKIGVIDSSGSVVFPAKYNGVGIGQYDHFKVGKKFKWGLVNKEGEEIVPPDYESMWFTKHNSIEVRKKKRWGVYSLSGDTILLPKYLSLYQLGDGLIKMKKKTLWGLASEDSILKEPSYDVIRRFKDGLAITELGGCFGIINKHGEDVIAPDCNYVRITGNLVKGYRDHDLEFVDIDDDAHVLGRTTYDNVKRVNVLVSELKATRVMKPYEPANENKENTYEWYYSQPHGKWGLMDVHGNIRIKPSFDNLIKNDHWPFTIVEIRDSTEYWIGDVRYMAPAKYGVVNNNTGSYISKPIYIEIRIDDILLQRNKAAMCIRSDGFFDQIRTDGKKTFRNFKFFVPSKNSFSMGGAGKGDGSVELIVDNDPNGAIADLNEYLASFNIDLVPANDKAKSLQGKKAYIKCPDCRWSYMQSNGYAIFEEYVDIAKPFIKNRAVVMKDRNWGIGLPKERKLDLRYKYAERIGGCEPDVFRVMDEKPTYGFIDTTGNLKLGFKYAFATTFSEGLAVIDSGRGFGYLNEMGDTVIRCVYEAAEPFVNGLAKVQKEDQWGMIRPDGTVFLPFEYSKIGEYSDGLIWVKRRGKGMYLDEGGERFSDMTFKDGKPFVNGVAPVKFESYWGIINKQGEWVVQPKYKRLNYDPANSNHIVVKGKNGYGLIAPNGKTLLGAKYDKMYAAPDYSATFQRNGKSGFLSLDGKQIKLPYKKVQGLKEGLARFFKKGKWGFIDEAGEVVIEPQFRKVYDFKSGLAEIDLEGKTGYMDKAGRVVIKPVFTKKSDWINGFIVLQDSTGKVNYFNRSGNRLYKEDFDDAMDIQSGKARVNVAGKWGVLSLTGDTLIDFKYDEIGDVSGDIWNAAKYDYYGVINHMNEELVAPEYESIDYECYGIYRVTRNNKSGYFSLSTVKHADGSKTFKKHWFWELND